MSTIAISKNLYSPFHPVVLSDQVGLAKPDEDIYVLLLNQLGLSADECIYVDDIAKNLEPAKVLGMKTVLASNNPNQTISFINALIIES